MTEKFKGAIVALASPCDENDGFLEKKFGHWWNILGVPELMGFLFAGVLVTG